MSNYKEYTVTTESLEATDSVWEDLLSLSGSDTIPSRIVEVANAREVSAYNTVYFLTDEEALNLKKDSRVIEVQDLNILSINHCAFQDSLFDKVNTSTGARSNWGLLRHVSTTNVFGSSTADPGGTYDYVLDGTGVDVVIVDSGIQADHPEFLNYAGTESRLKQINWFTASGVAGTMPANFYTDYHGHGTHVAATVAGRTFGWAKNADIYAIKLSGLQGGADPNTGLSAADAFDCIQAWHTQKMTGAGNRRPTIVNNSWGYSFYWHENSNSISFSPVTGGTMYSITSQYYRGVTYNTNVKDTARGTTGAPYGDGVWQMPIRVSAVDADINSLAAAGVIVCNAAGNQYSKMDVVGGVDYYNYVLAGGFGFYYNQGSSPQGTFGSVFTVGSAGASVIGALDRKTNFSNSGPAVNIYAIGDRVMSAAPTNYSEIGTPANYYFSSSFRQISIGGTSMASPQMAGLAALLAQAHPDWTPRQIVGWFFNNAKPEMYNTALDNDYNVTSSIHGGYNKLAYFPMNARKNYQIVAS